MNGARPAKRMSPERLDKHCPRRASGQTSEAANIRHTANRRFADTVDEWHTGIGADELLGASGAARNRAEGFLLGVVHFKNLQQARQFQNLARRPAQAIQCKPAFQVTRELQTLNQRGYARAVDVFHLLQVHNHAFDALFLQQVEEDLADFRSVIQRDIARNVDNRSVLKLTRGNIHVREPSSAPVFCQRLRIYATLFESRRNADDNPESCLANRGSPPDSAAMIDRDIAAQIVAQVYLTRPRDLLFGIEQHLLPLRDPSRSSRNRK